MKQRILTVDDEVEVTELLAFNLTAAGFDVDQAHDGLEAIATARRTRPDLILLDVMLPEMDGFSVCEILRRTPETANTPIVLLTGWASEAARRIGMESGASDYVVKPFSTRELVGRLRMMLPGPEAPGNRKTEM
jgi:DNA-binding response OmpR family regulator